ncbi:MAG: hypothetical protein LIP10_03590 [Clostridiales bacterium]|nr:hypothetical protein [Clostridiales bacterium]
MSEEEKRMDSLLDAVSTMAESYASLAVSAKEMSDKMTDLSNAMKAVPPLHLYKLQKRR